MSRQRIAVIGAGLAGLSCARRLAADHAVTVFEKSRGVGGRLATRYSDNYQFDHGAQFFLSKTPEFAAFIAPFIEDGILQRWQANFVEIYHTTIDNERQWSDNPSHYVGCDKMTALPKALAAGLDVRLSCRITAVERAGDGWQLQTDEETLAETFDTLIIAIPPAQAQTLLPATHSFQQTLAHYQMQACYSLLLGTTRELPVAWQAACVKDNIISWISLDNSKPQRDANTSIVALSTNAFADQHVDESIAAVVPKLRAAVLEIIGINDSELDHQDCHRWRYANSPKQLGPQAFYDADNSLGLCGDWCIQGRVEAAFLSAMDLLKQMSQ